MGSITITGIKAGLNGVTIVHNTVSGTHKVLNDYKFQGGELSGTVFDGSGTATITSGSVTIPVRGIKGGSSYEFTDGDYSLSLTVNATVYNNLTVRFSGSKGTAVATGGLAP
jgi:hypothetical protein